MQRRRAARSLGRMNRTSTTLCVLWLLHCALWGTAARGAEVIPLVGLGFDTGRLVRLADEAVDTAARATGLSDADASVLGAALRRALLEPAVPGYPDHPPALFASDGGGDNLGNPLTVRRSDFRPDLGRTGASVQRVLAAPRLALFAEAPVETSGVRVLLTGQAGVVHVDMWRQAAAPNVPLGFLFDERAALAFLERWPGARAPLVSSVTLCHASSSPDSTGPAAAYDRVGLRKTAEGIWRTSEPIPLPAGRKITYYFEVTAAEAVPLGDGTSVERWLVPDPYNLQFTDRGALARLAEAARAHGTRADDAGLPIARVRRFASLLARGLMDAGDIGLASSFVLPRASSNAWFAAIPWERLEALPDGPYSLQVEASDAAGRLVAASPSVPLLFDRDFRNTLNLSAIAEAVFDNELFRTRYVARIGGTVTSRIGMALSAATDNARVVLSQAEEAFSAVVAPDASGGFSLLLEEGAYRVTAAADGHASAETTVAVSQGAPVPPLDIELAPSRPVPLLPSLADVATLEDTPLTLALSSLDAQSGARFRAWSNHPSVRVSVEGNHLRLTSAADFHTADTGPVAIDVSVQPAEGASQSAFAVGGEVRGSPPAGAYVRARNLLTGAEAEAPVWASTYAAAFLDLEHASAASVGAPLVVELFDPLDPTQPVARGARVVRPADIAAGSAVVHLSLGEFQPAPHARTTARFRLSVLPGNDPPILGPFSEYIVTAGQSVVVLVPVSDVDDTDFSFRAVVPPSLGTLSLDAAARKLTFTAHTPGGRSRTVDSFTLVASDGKNDSNSATVVVTILPPPHASARFATTPEDTPVEVALSAEDEEGQTFEIVSAPTRGRVVLRGRTALYTPERDFSGTDRFTFRAMGASQIAPGEAVVEVVPVDDRPVLRAGGHLRDASLPQGSRPLLVELTGLFTDVDSEVVFSAQSSDEDVVRAEVSGGRLLLRPGRVGAVVITVGAAGAEEVVRFRAEVTPAVANQSPRVSRIPPVAMVSGERKRFSVPAADPDGDPLSYRLLAVRALGEQRDGDAEIEATVHPQTGVVEALAARSIVAERRFLLFVEVSDGVTIPAVVGIVVRVRRGNRPPLLSVQPRVEGAAGTDVSVVVQASDPDGDAVALRAFTGSASPAAREAARRFNVARGVQDGDALVKALVLSLPESSDVMTVEVEWTADDGTAVARAATTIETQGIGPRNRPPVLQPFADWTVDEGASLEVPVIAGDEDGDVLTVHVTGLPRTAAFDEQTRTIRWHPVPYDAQGSYVLTVHASDGVSTTRDSFRVEVRDVNRAPEFAEAPDAVVLTRGYVGEFALVGSDPDGDEVHLDIAGLPSFAYVAGRRRGTRVECIVRLWPPDDGEDFSVTARLTDSLGLAVETTIHVTLAEPLPPPGPREIPPSVVLDPISSGSESSVLVSGRAEPGAAVSLTIDGRAEATVRADAAGRFLFMTRPLADGAHEVALSQEAGGGGVLRERVVVDTSPPSVAILSPGRGARVPSLRPAITALARFGPGGVEGGVEMRLNGEPVSAHFDAEWGRIAFTPPEPLAIGRIYLVSVRVQGRNGMRATAASTFTVDPSGEDTSPPVVVLTEPGAGVFRAPTVAAVIADGESGIALSSVRLFLNGSVVGHETTPLGDGALRVSMQPTAPLPDGTHGFRIVFEDRAGNESAGEWKASVDATPPDAPTFDQSFRPVARSPAMFVRGSAEPGSLVSLFVEGEEHVVPAGERGGWEAQVTLGSDGTHVLRAVATDAAGNTSALSERTVLLDREPPGVRLISPALGASSELRPRFEGYALDALSGVRPEVSLRLDGREVAVAYDARSGRFFYEPNEPLSSGSPVRVRVAAEDMAGNVAVLEGDLLIGGAPPDVKPPVVAVARVNGVVATPERVLRVRDEDAWVALFVAGNAASVAGTFDGAGVSFTVAGGVAELSVAGVDEGEHVLLAQATDAEGNSGPVHELRFVRDASTTPPVFDEFAAVVNDPRLELTGEVEEGAAVEVFVNGTPVAARAQGSRFSATVARLSEGRNEIVAVATDGAGNTASSRTISAVLDTRRPRVEFVEPSPGASVPVSAGRVLVRFADDGGVEAGSVRAFLDGVALAVAATPAGFSYTAPGGFGAESPGVSARHLLIVRVQDRAGNEQVAGMEFFTDGEPPRIEGIVPRRGESVQTAEPVVSGTIPNDDFDPNTLEVLFGVAGRALENVVGSRNFHLVRATGQFVFTPSLADGETYQLVVIARDTVGNAATAETSFTVELGSADTLDPLVSSVYPAPGGAVNDTGLDIIRFTVGDASGVDQVYLFLNDPDRATPLRLGQLEEEGTARFDRWTGEVVLDARRLFRPLRPDAGFSLDPAELKALEQGMGAGGVSLDPLEVGAIHELPLQEAVGDAGGHEVLALRAVERGLASGAGVLGAGRNTIGVQVGDLAGNVVFREWSFDVLTRPPESPVLEAPPVTNTLFVAVRGTAGPEDGPASEATPLLLALLVNGVPSHAALVRGMFEASVGPLSEGENQVVGVLRDVAGNVSSPARVRVVLDSVAPWIEWAVGDGEVGAIHELPLQAFVRSRSVEVSGIVRDNLPLPVREVVLVVNGEERGLVVEGGRFREAVTLGDGENVLFVRATDAAGNMGATAAVRVTVDRDAPTTAPTALDAVPTLDGKGLVLSWDADPDAGAYDVFRSETPFADARGLPPPAAQVRGTSYVDRRVEPGRTYHYAVASVDRAGNRGEPVISPVVAATLVTSAGGDARLGDGTHVRIPAGGLSANALQTAAVLLSQGRESTAPSRTIAQLWRITATAPNREPFRSFRLPATLTFPVPEGVAVTGDSPRLLAQTSTGWAVIPSVGDATRRTRTAEVSAPGAFVLVRGSPAPWDINDDGRVDILDLVAVALRFGDEPGYAPEDVNEDGRIDVADLTQVGAHFGETTGTMAAAAPSGPSRSAEVALAVEYGASEGGWTEVRVLAEASDVLGGCELHLRLDPGRVARVEAGEMLGPNAFVALDGSDGLGVRIAVVRVDRARADVAAARSGVLGRLFVRVPAPEMPVGLLDARVVDASGRPLGYRLLSPTGVRATTYRTALYPNYPNPFNAETWIPFSLAEDADVRVRVYDARGALVRTFSLGLRAAGDHTSPARAARWDGRNTRGESVASGVYFVRIEAGRFSAVCRVVLSK